MKRFIYFLTLLFIISSCATTKETKTTEGQSSREKKLVDQETIKNAIESRRFIVKFDRYYPMGGGIIDLFPKYNYIVIEGEKALLSAAYFGRQYFSRPIAGFNMNGRTLNYQAIEKSSNGLYDIRMKLGNEKNTFDVDLTIGKDGECSVSLSNVRTDYARYRGFIVPIEPVRQPDSRQQPEELQQYNPDVI